MSALRVAYDPLPIARWGSLFHVLLLEHPEVRLEWQAASCPRRSKSRLDGADVGLFLEPRDMSQHPSLRLASSPMAVLLAAGHQLARRYELRVADVLDEPFLGEPGLDPEWLAFWTLDAYRGGPPRVVEGALDSPETALRAIAAGRAIGTFPEALADGLPHPGVVSLPLIDGPAVTTRLVWHARDPQHPLRTLIEIAVEMLGETTVPVP
jgi:LysR family hydrogen peroxide-inducible transcriptional activator